jgi:hypothetical protein
MRGWRLSHGVFIRIDFRGADLRGADLSDARRQHCDLRGADLRGTRLQGALYNPRWPAGSNPQAHGARDAERALNLPVPAGQHPGNAERDKEPLPYGDSVGAASALGTRTGSR